MKNFATILFAAMVCVMPMAGNASVFDLNTNSFLYDNYQKEFYIAVDGLRVRSTPQDDGKVMGQMDINEKVLVVSPELINNKYVEVKFLKTKADMLPADHYYIAQQYLAAKPVDWKDFDGKYFVVVNVATETLRLYERQCLDNSCPNKMIMETEVVVGEDKDHPITEKGKGRSILGSYRMTGWTKFYEDAEGHYPAWYKEGYPMPPAIGNNNWHDWFSNKVMPPGIDGEKDGKMRGAFGWYTAFVEPEAFGQWTHGTVGWGENKDEYIKKTKKFMINVISNPRSSGCTRNNNEAIAFLRSLINTGTPIIKIYAKEALMDPNLSSYQGPSVFWKYVMTKNPGQTAERAIVSKALGLSDADIDAYWNTYRSGGAVMIDPASKLNQILEVGTYQVDNQPTIIPYTARKKIFGKWRATGRNGNVYGVKDEHMSQGVYYIDSGFLNGYHHPTEILEVSGFMDEETPPWMDVRQLKRFY
ncbi:MAG: L,D-transpeptidase [Rhizobacter sp.]|nr:L,D-transpeptidase [Bacteriovorax sp.]